MWERLAAAMSNAAAASCIHKILYSGNLGFVYNQNKDLGIGSNDNGSGLMALTKSTWMATDHEDTA